MNKLIFGLIIICAVGCKSMPKLTWCSLNGDGSAQCLPPDDKEPHTVPAQDLENFVCVSPDDAQKLLEACKKSK